MNRNERLGLLILLVWAALCIAGITVLAINPWL